MEITELVVILIVVTLAATYIWTMIKIDNLVENYYEKGHKETFNETLKRLVRTQKPARDFCDVRSLHNITMECKIYQIKALIICAKSGEMYDASTQFSCSGDIEDIQMEGLKCLIDQLRNKDINVRKIEVIEVKEYSFI